VPHAGLEPFNFSRLLDTVLVHAAFGVVTFFFLGPSLKFQGFNEEVLGFVWYAFFCTVAISGRMLTRATSSLRSIFNKFVVAK